MAIARRLRGQYLASVLVTIVAFIVAAEREPAPNEDVSDQAPHAVVFSYPSSTLLMAASGLTHNPTTVYAVLGVSVLLGHRFGIDAEVAAGLMVPRSGGNAPGWVGSIGVGPSLQLGNSSFAGLFVTARVRFEAFDPPADFFGSLNQPPSPAGIFLFEVDVGYQFRLGRLYFAPLIGAGVGYAINYFDPTGVGMVSPFSSQLGPSPPKGLVWTVNLNLARLGIAL